MTQTQKTLDVLIVGAGLSGIGLACQLTRSHPQKSYRIIEARPRLGGTWDLFKYPGIRSDSDLYTFAFPFKPWTSSNAIASADEILDYLREAVEEYSVSDHILYNSRVTKADWDSAAGFWTVTLQSDRTTQTLNCRWLFSAAGYFDYETAHRPELPNEAEFSGEIVHAQFWPESLKVSGKRVAVIGSGATAITLVPALVSRGAQVTQVQRTPSYVVPLPQRDFLTKLSQSLLSKERSHQVLRWRNARLQLLIYKLYQRFPRFGRWHIRREALKYLPAQFAYDTHFNPPYDPWDQRVCVAPDGDFFEALSDGTASIATDRIETLCKDGILLEGGTHIPADIIVLATGLNIRLMGGIQLRVDGTCVDFADRFVFRGMMLDDVPNFAFAVGYTNASWTLKVALVFEHFADILTEMDRRQVQVARVVRPLRGMSQRPLMDFGAGYIQRSLEVMPKQGPTAPWSMNNDYFLDKRVFRNEPVDHPALQLLNPDNLRTS